MTEVILPPLAKVSDLEARMKRTFEDADADEAAAALEEASEIVREESRNTWVSPEDSSVITAPRIVRIIVLRVAERKLRNPDGLSSETAGDYSYQRNGVGPDGGLYLTKWEIDVLRRQSGQTGLWTQPTTRGDVYCRMVFLEDTYGCELFPVGDIGVYPYYDDC